MQTKLSPKIAEFAHKAAQIPGLKFLLKPFYYKYKRHIDQNRNKVFKQNALGVLFDFDKTLRENDIPYSVFAGTLLGAVRDKGFIKYDLDIDTCIWNEDYSPLLETILKKAGFILTRRFEIEKGNKGREETYHKDGIDIDIFYIYTDAQFDSYQCDFGYMKGTASHEESMNKYGCVKTRRIEFPIRKKFVRLPFESIEVNAIINYNEWLRCRYGENFMIPDPTFEDKGDNPNIRIWEEVKATYWWKD